MVRQAHHERLSRKVYSINNTPFFKVNLFNIIHFDFYNLVFWGVGVNYVRPKSTPFKRLNIKKDRVLKRANPCPFVLSINYL
ncbi:Uncharacterised protein [Moraxella lacunata]|uniref:Uncharacterized protein n=1 Tax=Moraxella lacunata TaxID=477 RepID=A0A378TS06_MORLA|nr:Uncharacterised protein [Moraxella lacunata]